MIDKIPMTPAGYVKLEAELADRKGVQRPRIITAISEARALGDLSENAEYHSAKEEQGFNERRISYLEGAIGSAEIIDPKKLSGAVKFGATIKFVDTETDEEKTYQIVGKEEADIGQNKIALDSPIARAMMGKNVGDEIDVASPRGVRNFELLEIKFI